MRNEIISIEGVSPNGYAIPTGSEKLMSATLQSWTLLWISKLAVVTNRFSLRQEEHLFYRLKSCLEKVVSTEPSNAKQLMMSYSVLCAIHRLERYTARNDDTFNALSSIETLERAFVRQPSNRRRTDLLDAYDYPEFAKFRTRGETSCSLDDEIVRDEIDRALSKIDSLWPEAGYELRTYIQAILPLEMAKGHYNSASSDEVPFVVQVTIQPNAWIMFLAESLIHEMSHIKLDIASSLQPLLAANEVELAYNHPWRPDKRPLIGVLLGAHAFLGVMDLYKRAIKQGFDTDQCRSEFELRRNEVGQCIEILETRRISFTPFGLEIFDQIRNHYCVLAN